MEFLSSFGQSVASYFGVDPSVILAAIAVILFHIILLLVGLAWKRRHESQPKSTLLLTGYCGSGKTTLFAELLGRSVIGSVTSMKPNEFKLRIEDGNKSRKIDLVDFPGHRRVRNSLNQYIPNAGCIVFMVDAKNPKAHIRETADYLYDLLVNPTINNNMTPIIIMCNKIDSQTSPPFGNEEIKKLLERELDALRQSKSLEVKMDGSMGDGIYLGVEGEAFDFSKVPLDIKFIGSDVRLDTKEIKRVINKTFLK